MRINSRNVTGIMERLRSSLSQPVENYRTFLVVPQTVRGPIDRTKYRGKGRPREDDYVRIPFLDHVNAYARIVESQ